MLLNAFGVPADVVSQVQYDITPATTTPQVATSTPPSNDTPVVAPTNQNNVTPSTDQSTAVQSVGNAFQSQGIVTPPAPPTITTYYYDPTTGFFSESTSSPSLQTGNVESMTCPSNSSLYNALGNTATTTIDMECIPVN